MARAKVGLSINHKVPYGTEKTRAGLLVARKQQRITWYVDQATQATFSHPPPPHSPRVAFSIHA